MMEQNKTKNTEEILGMANTLQLELGIGIHDKIVSSLYADAAQIARKTVSMEGDEPAFSLDRKIDKIVTSRWSGFPIMFVLLAVVFWVTISGANYPSGLLASLLVDTLHPILKSGADSFMPWWLSGLLIDGAYLAMAWVISVMLPPMAIFFPLFTLLEDLGYLPRVAFNMDS